MTILARFPLARTPKCRTVFGKDLIKRFNRLHVYVDRILRGERPADPPVQTPTKFEMIINLKTAKALGLNVPPALLATADEVIE